MRTPGMAVLFAVCFAAVTTAATNRVKIASVKGLSMASPVSGVSYVIPTAAPSYGTPNVPYMEGVDPSILAEVAAAAKESGVSMAVIQDAVKLSIDAGIELRELADVVRLPEAADMSAADIVALARMGSVKGVEIQDLKDVIAVSRGSGVPMSVLSDIVVAEGALRLDAIAKVLAVATNNAIPSAKLTDIIRASSAAHITLDDLPSVVALSSSMGITAETFVAVYAASTVDMTEEVVRDIIMAAIANGIEPADLRRIVALAQINNGRTSRFDALAPRTFSRMWAIKEKAKKVESCGGNTDAMWKTYWDLFAQDAMSEDVDDGL